MKILESGENYLETILVLQKKRGNVRAVDVANELNFSKPSVSRALGILRAEELIAIDGKSGIIAFTPEGLARATSVYERHRLLSRYLSEVLGVPAAIAEADACRIEHVISPETFEAIKDSFQSDRT